MSALPGTPTNTTLYFNRAKKTNPTEADFIQSLDATGRAPLAREPQYLMHADTQAKLAQAAAAANVPLAPQTRRITRAHRTHCSTAPAGLGAGDNRRHTAESTMVSTHNRVVPVFPSSIAPSKAQCFAACSLQIVQQARSFIFVEAFELERPELVQALIARAAAGVQVVVWAQPHATAPHPKRQKQSLDALFAAQKKISNLHVYTYETPDDKPGIQHTKKIICDRPGFPIAELSGGINFGLASSRHVDAATYTEGVAAIDSLAHLIRQVGAGRYKRDLNFDCSRIPSVALVLAEAQRQNALPKSRGEFSCTIEMAACGRQKVEQPRTYTLEALQRHLADKRRVILSSRVFTQPKFVSLLQQYLPQGYQGSWITVVMEPMNEAETQAFGRMRKRLRDHGALILASDAITEETSYRRALYRNIDHAIKAREPIDVAAYCLTETALLERLKIAHAMGCRVRVLVDDLTVGGCRINQKAVAHLTAAGIEVRIADAQAVHATSIRPSSKPGSLHAKTIILGPRVAMGSANFTQNGLVRNIEDGRFVHNPNIAASIRNAVFEPLWHQSHRPINPTPILQESQRTLLLCTPPPMDTSLDKLTFLVADIETSGLDAPGDQRILSISARAIQQDKTGKWVWAKESFHRYATPGNDMQGKPFVVPASAVAVHGLNRSRLDKLGATPVDSVLADFIAFVRHTQQKAASQGRAMALAGQNLRFDLSFLDQVLSRQSIAQASGIGPTKTDGCFVDSLYLSQQFWPSQRAHNLDAILRRLRTPAPPQNQTPSPMHIESAPMAEMHRIRYLQESSHDAALDGKLGDEAQIAAEESVWRLGNEDESLQATPEIYHDASAQNLAKPIRGLHDSKEDVLLTGEALLGLIGRLRPQTLGQLLHPDKLDALVPIALCLNKSPTKNLTQTARTQRMQRRHLRRRRMRHAQGSSSPSQPTEPQATHRLERGPMRGLFLRRVAQDGSLTDEIQRVNHHALVGYADGLVLIETTTGSGSKAQTQKFRADPAALSFTQAGIWYHRMQEAGHALPRPREVQGNRTPILRLAPQ